MNGDLQELMTHIGELHSKEMEAISDLKASFAEHKGNITARVSATEAAIESVQADQKSAARRQWLHSMVVVPIIGIAHAVANHFGIKV